MPLAFLSIGEIWINLTQTDYVVHHPHVKSNKTAFHIFTIYDYHYDYDYHHYDYHPSTH